MCTCMYSYFCHDLFSKDTFRIQSSSLLTVQVSLPDAYSSVLKHKGNTANKLKKHSSFTSSAPYPNYSKAKIQIHLNIILSVI